MPTIHEDLVREYAALRDDLERITARKKEIEKALRDLDYGSHDIAGVTIQIQHNRRLDPALLEDRYPVAKFPHFYRPSVNTAQVRKQLAPAEIDELSKEGDKKVLLK